VPPPISHLGGVHLADFPARVCNALLGEGSFPCQYGLDVALELQGIKGWPKACGRAAFSIHNELGVVPGDLALLPGDHEVTGQVLWLALLQDLVHRVRVLPVHLNLIHDGELKAKLLVGKLSLLLRAAWSLPTKLVAGECNEVESLFVVLLVQRPQTGIVHVL